MLDAIQEAEAALAELDKELKDAEENVTILRAEKKAAQNFLKRLRARRFAAESETKTNDNAVVQVINLSAPNGRSPEEVESLMAHFGVIGDAKRHDMMQSILDTAGKPLTLAELEVLANATTGISWTPEQIRSAVSTLGKKNPPLARRVERGVWASAKTSAESAGTDSAETVPTTRPEGGSPGVEPPTSVIREDHGPLGEREAVDPDRETDDRYVVQF